MVERRSQNLGYDYLILIPTVLLLGLGLVIVYSASTHLADMRLGDGYYYLKKQAFFGTIGLSLMIAARHVPPGALRRAAIPLLGLSTLLLVLVLIPGLGLRAGGASRWLRIGGMVFQPSEMAKFSLAVFLAFSMARKGAEMAAFSRGLLPYLVLAFGFMGIIVVQPDLGTAVIIGAWTCIMLFVGGARIWHLALLAAASVPCLIYMIMREEYRFKRWLAFLNPWEDPRGFGFQIIHSFLAFGSGGFMGAGLGDSKQKLFYLPEPHTDFALSIAAEELGFLGVSFIILLFGILIIRGLQVSLRARDLPSSYLAFGLTLFLGLQVLINMGVVMGLLPTKGLTLPFISYGGSSLVMNLMAVGVLLSIAARR